MVKKIKFPLEMANGVMVRTLEELKDNFDLEKIIIHYKSGKLLTWLKDRYYEDEAKKVENLILESTNIDEQLSNIFGIDYCKEMAIDIEAIEERTIRLNKLKQFTDDEEIIKNIDRVAFNQKELSELLDKKEKIIYICDNKFNVPIEIEDVTYIGINNVIVNIQLENQSILEERKIKFINTIVKNNGKVIKLDKQYKRDWEVFSRKEYIFKPNIWHRCKNKEGKIYNLEIISLFARDKRTGFERRITSEKESLINIIKYYKDGFTNSNSNHMENYIIHKNKVFYTVGFNNIGKLFVIDLDTGVINKVIDCELGLWDIYYITDEYILLKIDKVNYVVNHNTIEVKETLHAKKFYDIHKEKCKMIINDLYIYISENNLYSKNILTGQTKLLLRNIEIMNINGDYIYYVIRSDSGSRYGRSPKEYIERFNIITEEREVISAIEQEVNGKVMKLASDGKNIVWINHGAKESSLWILNINSKKIRELDKWINEVGYNKKGIKLDEETIYYAYEIFMNKNSYKNISRKIKIDGTDKVDIENKLRMSF